MIDFEIDSILGDGDVEDLMLVSFAAPMPRGFGFCEQSGSTAFGNTNKSRSKVQARK